jgi:hypothetical protein
MLELCPAVTIGFALKTKNTHFVKDHSMNIPAKFTEKGYQIKII